MSFSLGENEEKENTIQPPFCVFHHQIIKSNNIDDRNKSKTVCTKKKNQKQ